jgi:hypothetical protein
VPALVAPDGSGLRCVPLTLANPSTDHSLIGHVVEVTLYNPQGQPITQFAPSLNVCVTYTDSDLQAVASDTGQFVILSQEDNGPWSELPTTVDTTARTVCGQTSHLSRFGLFSKVVPAPSGLSTVWVIAGACGLAFLAGAVLLVGFLLWRRERESNPYN